jgi:uncharacterized protein
VTEQEKVKQSEGFPTRYFAFAFAWAWVFWAVPLCTTRGWLTQPTLGGLRNLFLIVGAYAPFVAAFALSFRDGTAWALFKRAFRWRIPPLVLLTALILFPAVAGVAIWLHSMQGGPKFGFTLGWHDVPLVMFFLFFLGGSFNEEFGWAYAIDRLQARWGYVKSSLLLGVIWALWHLPLFFMPTQSQSHMPFWTFLIQCCSVRLLFVWAYNHAGKSILVTLLFHTSLNFAPNLFAILNPTVSADKQATWMYYVALMAVAAAVVAIFHVQRERGRESAVDLRS